MAIFIGPGLTILEFVDLLEPLTNATSEQELSDKVCLPSLDDKLGFDIKAHLPITVSGQENATRIGLHFT